MIGHSHSQGVVSAVQESVAPPVEDVFQATRDYYSMIVRGLIYEPALFLNENLRG